MVYNPKLGKDLHCINYADKDNLHGIQQGLYPLKSLRRHKRT